MKRSVKPSLLKYATLSAGILGLALRLVLYTTGMDENGLLLTGHWADIGTWLLTAAVILGLFLLRKKIPLPGENAPTYPVSCFSALGTLVLTLAVLSTGFSRNSPLLLPLSIAAAAALLYLTFCHITGRVPCFLGHTLVCLFFVANLILLYQDSCRNPQLQDYLFQLSAQGALMLCAYQHTAFDADLGNHPALWGTSLAAVYLCCLSAANSGDLFLTLAGGFWAWSNLTNLTSRPRRQRPQINLEEA